MKFSIGVPCLDSCPTDFAFTLARLAYLAGSGRDEFQLIAPRNYDIVKARNEIVRQALTNGSSHLFFLDSDMTVPVDCIYRLLAHAKPIVGAYGVMRRFPIVRCGEPLDQWTDHGLIEMKSMGLAVCLINVEIFKKLTLPAFEWGAVSEDVGFCTKARAAGLKIWCDADLSREVGHIGQHIFQ